MFYTITSACCTQQHPHVLQAKDIYSCHKHTLIMHSKTRITASAPNAEARTLITECSGFLYLQYVKKQLLILLPALDLDILLLQLAECFDEGTC